MKYLTIPITAPMEGRSVRSVLLREGQMAASYISALKFREAGILLNSQPVRTVDAVREGNVLAARIDDEGGGNPAEPMEAPLRFVWEDEYLAVLDKRPGMAVHGSLRGGECTVANALAYLWGSDQPFHPVNRLDKGTSGLMLIAKSAYVHDRLRRALHTDGLHREYLALTEGPLCPEAGVITLPIGPDEGTRRRIDPNGQSAETEYEQLSCREGVALVRCVLRTGRTHQIRVHFSAIGHPLLGDGLYGGAARTGLARPALHSCLLRFTHPVTGESVECSSPLPQDLAEIWGSGSL